MSNALDGMISEGSVQANMAMVMARTKTVHGISRTMIGGIILHDMNIPESEGGWMRWRGGIILTPQIIERNRKPLGHSLAQMVTGYLNVDTDDNLAERAKKNHDSIWQPTFWNK